MAKSPTNSATPFANPFGDVVGRMMRETATMQAEMLQFISKRVNADMQASKEIWGSKNPTEAAEAVQRYYEKAFEDYLTQANEMVDATCAIVDDLQVPHDWQSSVPGTGKDKKSLNT